VLRPYGLLEVVRTGIVAMRRGVKTSGKAESKANGKTAAADDGNVSYSV
jgi:Small subunit of acetolactate synthase